MIDIDKAFEGRWHYKWPDYDECEVRRLTSKQIKELCRDFFETGAFIAQTSVCNEIDPTTPTISISSVEEANAFLMEQDFKYWWDLYDKKCGHKDCLKKWKKLSMEERHACIAATPSYVASTPDKQYRKNPLSYLNQKAWNDEIIVRHNPDQQRQQRLAEAAERIAEYTKDGK